MCAVLCVTFVSGLVLLFNFESKKKETYAALAPTLNNGVYEINDLEQLRGFRDIVNGATIGGIAPTTMRTASVKLTADLTFPANENWNPIGNRNNSAALWAGVFDGAGHTITNLYVDAVALNVGTDSKVLNAFIGGINATVTVKNITFINPRIVGRNGANTSAAVIAATNTTGGTYNFDNCHVIGGSVSGQGTGDYQTGGIVGGINNQSGSATIRNCSVRDTVIEGEQNVGGIAGRAVGTTANTGVIIENCFSAANVRGTGVPVGGIVGNAEGTTIKNCYSTGAISGIYAGGIVGEIKTTACTVENVFSSGNVTTLNTTASVMSGGIAAAVRVASTLKNCIVTGNYNGYTTYATANSGAHIHGVAYTVVAGITMNNCVVLSENMTGYAPNTTYQTPAIFGSTLTTGNKPTGSNNIYYSGVNRTAWKGVTEANGSGPTGNGYASLADFKNLATYTGANANWNASTTVISNNGTAVWNITPSVNGGFPYLTQPSTWNTNNGVTPWINGNKLVSPLGAKENPWQISTRADLEALRDSVVGGNRHAGEYYEMTNDIEMGGTKWAPIGTAANPFSGIFDGKGFKLLNFWSETDMLGQPWGLFRATAQATIRNLIITNADIRLNNTSVLGADNGVGVLIGNLTFASTVDNCHVIGGLLSSNCGSSVGGLVGQVNDNCVVRNSSVRNLEVSGASAVGGIAGESVGTVANTGVIIENCFSSANVRGANAVGGIVGIVRGTTVRNCYTTGATAAIMGSSVFTGAHAMAGGIAGISETKANNSTTASTFQNNLATGNVYSVAKDTSSCTGGIVGWERVTNNGSTYKNNIAAGQQIAFTELNNNGAAAAGIVYTQSVPANVVGNAYIGNRILAYAPNYTAQSSSPIVTGWTSNASPFVTAQSNNLFNDVMGSPTSYTRTGEYLSPIKQVTVAQTSFVPGTPTPYANFKNLSTYTNAGWSGVMNSNGSGVWNLDAQVNGGLPYLMQPSTWNTNGGKTPWLDASGTKLFSPQGSKENPWQISSKADLEALRNSVNGINGQKANRHAGEYYELTRDIDLKGEWNTPIGTLTNPFGGIFDGSNKIISNLKNPGAPSASNYGLFGVISQATIKNVRLTNVNVVSSATRVGCLVGTSLSQCTIQNCAVIGGTLYGSVAVGPIIGYSSGISNDTIVSQCQTNVTVTAASSGGGIVGMMASGTIEQCFSIGNVTSPVTLSGYSLGGILGSFWSWKADGTTVEAMIGYTGTIRDCFSRGDVLVNGKNTWVVAGGILGHSRILNATITRCYATGDVLANCTATTSVAKEGAYASGIAGYLEWSSSALPNNLTSNVSISSKITATAPNANVLRRTPISMLVDTAYGGTQTNNIALSTQQYIGTEKGTGTFTKLTYTTKTSIELTQNSAVYTSIGWDFANTWYHNPNLNDKYPILKWAVTNGQEDFVNFATAPSNYVESNGVNYYTSGQFDLSILTNDFDVATYEYSLDNGATWDNNGMGFSITNGLASATWTVPRTADVLQTVQIRSINHANTPTNRVKTFKFYRQTIGPSFQIGLETANAAASAPYLDARTGEYWFLGSFNFFLSNPQDAVGLNKVEYQISGRTTVSQWTNLSGRRLLAGNGTYVIRVRVTDLLGLETEKTVTVKVTDKSRLAELIGKANAVNEEYYSSDSVLTLREALQDAMLVYLLSSPTPMQVVEATANLEAALTGLQFNIAELDQIIKISAANIGVILTPSSEFDFKAPVNWNASYLPYFTSDSKARFITAFERAVWVHNNITDSDPLVMNPTVISTAISDLNYALNALVIDQSELIRVYNIAISKQSQYYTTETFQDLSQVIDDAKKHLNPGLIQPETYKIKCKAICDAIMDLEDALSKLEFNATLLGTFSKALTDARAVNQSDPNLFTSLEELQAAIATAESVQTRLTTYGNLENEHLYAEEIAVAIFELNTTIHGLQINKAFLDLFFVAAEKIKNGGKGYYTTKTWDDFINAYNDAKSAAEGNDVAEIVNTLFDLVKSMQDLRVDYTIITAFLAKYHNGDWEESLYTAQSWAILLDAVDNSERPVNLALLTNKQLTEIIIKNENAVKGLAPNKTILQNLINQCQSINNSGFYLIGANRIGYYTIYTGQTWNEFDTALTEAIDVFKKYNAEISEVEDAFTKLQTAKNALAPNRPALVTLIGIANDDFLMGYNGSNFNPSGPYTRASLDLLLAAVATANGATITTANDLTTNINTLAGVISSLGTNPAALNELLQKAHALEPYANHLVNWANLLMVIQFADEALEGELSDDTIKSLIALLSESILELSIDKSSYASDVTWAESYLKYENFVTTSSFLLYRQKQNAFKALVLADLSLPNGASVRADYLKNYFTHVDTAVSELVTAIGGLTASNSWLVSELQTYGVVGNSDPRYEYESWTVFAALFHGAEAITQLPNATYVQLYTAHKDMLDAFNALVPEKSELRALVIAANLITNENDYFPANAWAQWRAQIAIAQSVLDNNNATVTQVQTQIHDMKSAENDLYRAKLSALIAAGYNRIYWNTELDIYSSTSIANLETQIENAEDVAEDSNTTTSEIRAAISVLQNAIDNLVFNNDALGILLEHAKEKVQEQEENDIYTPDSISALEDVIGDSQLVYDNIFATPEEIKTACNNLIDALNNLVDATDLRDRYNDILSGIRNLTETNYTTDTWDDLQGVITYNEQNPPSTATSWIAAIKNLSDAYDALISVVALRAIESEANAKYEINYSQLTWSALEDALDGIDLLYKEGDDESIAQKVAAIRAALDSLANIKTLQNLIAEIEALSINNYTDNTFNALIAEKNRIVALNLQINGTKSTVISAEQSLLSFKDALVFVVFNGDNLKSLLSTYEQTYTENNPDNFYPVIPFNEFVAAYNTAKTASIQGTEQNVKDAIVALKNAFKNLVPIPGLNNLKKLYDDNVGKLSQKTDYTADSFAKFETAMKDAQTIITASATMTIPNEIYESAILNLTNAINGLRIDKTELEILYEEVKDYSLKYFANDANWTTFESKLAIAKDVLDDKNDTKYTIAQYNTALAELKSAVANLTTLWETGKPELNQLINECDAYLAKYYSPLSWDKFQTVLSKAKLIYANDQATIAQINIIYDMLDLSKELLQPGTGFVNEFNDFDPVLYKYELFLDYTNTVADTQNYINADNYDFLTYQSYITANELALSALVKNYAGVENVYKASDLYRAKAKAYELINKYDGVEELILVFDNTESTLAEVYTEIINVLKVEGGKKVVTLGGEEKIKPKNYADYLAAIQFANENKTEGAATALETAIDNLSLIANKDALEQAIKDAEQKISEIGRDNIAPDKLAELENAINHAKELLDDPNAEQGAVDEATRQLGELVINITPEPEPAPFPWIYIVIAIASVAALALLVTIIIVAKRKSRAKAAIVARYKAEAQEAVRLAKEKLEMAAKEVKIHKAAPHDAMQTARATEVLGEADKAIDHAQRIHEKAHGKHKEGGNK